MLPLLLTATLALAAPAPPIATNRTWDVLTAPVGPNGARKTLHEAGTKLWTWEIQLAGVTFDGIALTRLAREHPDEPFTRVLREAWSRPVDVDDLLLFLDDVLVAGADREGERFVVSAGRARSAGILLHPDDVWKDKPRRYGTQGPLHVDAPVPPEAFPPAADGDPVGPNWSARYPNPSTKAEMLDALTAAKPDVAHRARALITQLQRQGLTVWLTSTVRRRERGYLMWGAFELSRCEDGACIEKVASNLDKTHTDWGLAVPIRWRHPDGWEATVEAARRMADAYQVVHATRNGARRSSHYDGEAFDVVGVGLPRVLELEAPDGVRQTFDLSDPEQPRDLSLTPALVTWIEAHWGLRKLRSDYPHWSDAPDD